MSLALPRLGADWGAAFFMPQLLPTDGRSVKAGTRMKNPRCLVAAPVLAGRTQITALGTKPRLSLVACVFLVLAVPVARVQAQSDAPPPNAAASFVSGHLKCVAYYATMSECLSCFSQKDETRYFNAAAAFLTKARELGGLYGEGPEIQEATTRELATVMERSVGSRCDNVRKLTDLRPLHAPRNRSPNEHLTSVG